ncbi:MAG: hypothetical protein KIS75_10635 [Chromatiales bacterium]|nr:hypothetical protein [Chromatiales bacterium]
MRIVWKKADLPALMAFIEAEGFEVQPGRGNELYRVTMPGRDRQSVRKIAGSNCVQLTEWLAGLAFRFARRRIQEREEASA